MVKIVGISRGETRIGGDETVRYLAPELIETTAPMTTKSDVFSCAMLMLECVTEEIPFSELRRDSQVIHTRFIKRQRPPRPGGPDPKKRVDSDDLWNLMMRCWSEEPDRRPAMAEVHSFFLSHV